MVETTKDNKEIILDIISEAFKHVKNAYDLSNEPNSSKIVASSFLRNVMSLSE